MANDFISRDKAANVLCMACGNAACDPFECSFYKEMETVPAADVRPVVRGEWERPKGYTPRSWIFVCSKCGDRAYFPVPKYFPKGCGYSFCPNCGADMRPSANDEKEV